MALSLARIIGTITGKLAFERTDTNFQAIQTEVNNQGTQINNLVTKTTFAITPATGITVLDSNSFIIGKIAYLNIGIKKTDDTVFTVGSGVAVGTIPNNISESNVPLSSVGFTTGGTPKDINRSMLQKWNKTISVYPVEADIKTIVVNGIYSIV